MTKLVCSLLTIATVLCVAVIGGWVAFGFVLGGLLTGLGLRGILDT